MSALFYWVIAGSSVIGLIILVGIVRERLYFRRLQKRIDDLKIRMELGE